MCGCSNRARWALGVTDHRLEDGKWYTNQGEYVIDDADVDDDHIYLLPLFAQAVALEAVKDMKERFTSAKSKLFG